MKVAVGTDSGLGKTLKFNLKGDGFVYIDGGSVTNEDKPADLTVVLRIGNLEQMVEVQADASNSVAAQLAPMDARLDARSARTEITSHFIENYTTPTADNTEMIFFAPGTFSVPGRRSRS